MNEISENCPIKNAQERNIDEESAARILTQDEVNEEIKGCIVPLTKQVENLTWLIQGIPSVQQTNANPKVGTKLVLAQPVVSPTTVNRKELPFVLPLRQSTPNLHLLKFPVG